MRKTGLINNISSKDRGPTTQNMQVLDEQSKAYFNFINSLKSESTRKLYTYCIEKFLGHYEKDLDQFLRLSQDEMTNLIIKYFVDNKISNQYKNLMSATLKHACEINDVVLNWKKIKKFINSNKTGNETNGKDRGYIDKEIQNILKFSDQRIRTAFLILASTGIRIGALHSLQINDLEKIDNLYKVTVYRGDTEEYFTFCTPECAKEIDSYLDFRARRGEKITGDSYLVVKQFDVKNGNFTGEPFNFGSLRSTLEDHIIISGINRPGMLFETIEKDPHSKYEKIILDYTVGLDKIYDRKEIEKKKNEPEFLREYGGQYLGRIGNLLLPSQIQTCINLGQEYSIDKIPVSLYTLKSVGIDPGFSSSATGIVVLEHIKPDNIKDKIRVIETYNIEKGDPNQIVNLCWDIYQRNNWMNTFFFIGGSNRAMVNLLKIKWQESLSWETKQSFGPNTRIRPVNFSMEHKNMLSNLHAVVSKGYLAIDEKHDKLITSLRTAYTERIEPK